MELAFMVLSLFANLPSPEDAPPERSMNLVAAYVRTLALRKGMNTQEVARTLGFEQCYAGPYPGAGSRSGAWFTRYYTLTGGRDLLLVYTSATPGHEPELLNWHWMPTGFTIGYFD